MKQKFLKKNCPRIARAIREAVLIVGRRSGWFGNYYYHSDIGRMVYELGLKADKYDVLNALCVGAENKVVTFARGDIRHRRHISELACLIILAVAFVLVIATAQVFEPD